MYRGFSKPRIFIHPVPVMNPASDFWKRLSVLLVRADDHREHLAGWNFAARWMALWPTRPLEIESRGSA